jgi:hypothetical protein
MLRARRRQVVVTEIVKLRKADADRRTKAAERQSAYRARRRGPQSTLPGKIKALTEENPLMTGFLIQAITTFAEEVAKADPEAITKATNRMVNGNLWVDCAKAVLAAGL